MTRVLALVGDLMFGSRLTAAASEAGIELELASHEARARERLACADTPRWDVLVVDLTDPQLDGAAFVGSLRASGELAGVRTLGFYAHVEPATRKRAEDVGFDLVVPRSRMAREGSALIRRLSG
jgi:CheY-like chemotaxis protein